MEKERKFWTVPVTAELDSRLERALADSCYSTKTDFIRSIVRQRIEVLAAKVTTK